MKKVTYVSGQYSQIKLDDGTRVFIETLPEKIRVKKIFIGVIPTKMIWEFQFPFYIRTVGGIWSLSMEILELVLESIKECATIDELRKHLSQNTTQLLRDYVEKNEDEAYKIGVDKLGGFAAKKYIKTSPILQATLAIPSEAMDIIGDYGKVLENLSKEGNNLLRPISKLPHPKEKIENALKTALKITKDEKIKNHLQIALMALDDFVPDEEIPDNMMENSDAWAKRRGLKKNGNA